MHLAGMSPKRAKVMPQALSGNHASPTWRASPTGGAEAVVQPGAVDEGVTFVRRPTGRLALLTHKKKTGKVCYGLSLLLSSQCHQLVWMGPAEMPPRTSPSHHTSLCVFPSLWPRPRSH